MSNLSDLKAAGGSGKSIDLVASGALANGDKVVLNTDGTVSVIDGGSIGSEVVFASQPYNQYNSATFDSNSNKVIIAFRDGGNSNYGTAIVGTVSGISISFGTAVVFNSGMSSFNSAVFDSNSNKVVIAYQQVQNSGYGAAVVGTVSGDSISFGSTTLLYADSNFVSATFDSNLNKVVIAYKRWNVIEASVGTVSGTSISFGSQNAWNSGSATEISSTFDSNSNKVVIAYRDDSGSDYGRVVVGTISGTSISFGSEYAFNSGNTSQTSSTFDSNSNKVVITYRDQGNLNYGTGIVGTVSGTSISFGSAVVFNTGETFYPTSTFDSSSNKVVIAYADAGNSNYGTAVVGTVSGTSITFSSEIVVNPANSAYHSTTFDSNSNKIVIAYVGPNTGGSGYSSAVVWQNTGTYTAPNLTATNFLGISEGAAADTATATVMLRGGITTTQSGLTTGSTYYVQADGTLSTTADSPSVVAGQALSATTLLIEGET
jgi:hypothetical protein